MLWPDFSLVDFALAILRYQRSFSDLTSAREAHRIALERLEKSMRSSQMECEEPEVVEARKTRFLEMVRAKRLAVLERFDAREQDGRRPVKTTSDSLSPVTTPRVHPKGDSESGSAGASARLGNPFNPALPVSAGLRSRGGAAIAAYPGKRVAATEDHGRARGLVGWWLWVMQGRGGSLVGRWAHAGEGSAVKGGAGGVVVKRRHRMTQQSLLILALVLFFWIAWLWVAPKLAASLLSTHPVSAFLSKTLM